MRALPFVLALFSVACSGEDTPMDAPGGGGGGGGGGTRRIDAGSLPPSDAGLIAYDAQLCQVDDLRTPNTCSPVANLAGVEIEDLETGLSTVADAQGFFTLPVPEDASILRLKVGFGNPTYHDLLVPVAASGDGVRIPVVLESTWESLMVTIGLPEPDGTASIAVYLVDNGSAVPGAEIIPPEGSAAPIYDGPGGPNDWLSGAVTGAFAAAIITSVPALLPEVSFSVSANAELQTITGVPVLDGALTFVTYDIL